MFSLFFSSLTGHGFTWMIRESLARPVMMLLLMKFMIMDIGVTLEGVADSLDRNIDSDSCIRCSREFGEYNTPTAVHFVHCLL